MSEFPSLNIGDLSVNPPIIQGGMGVRVSGPNLAAAVANEGAIGIIAGVGLGKFEDYTAAKFVSVNEDSFREAIRTARKNSNGIIGVNIMVVLSNYESLIKVAVEENVDMIISGSGLPLSVPKHVGSKNIKLIPIVSSVRTFKIICKKWQKSYNRLPDAVVVEGVKAGGHLGFSYQELTDGTAPSLETLVSEVVEAAKEYNTDIPVTAAGGIFSGEDINKFLKLGAKGVQMATRFVCTHECDVNIKFKEAYLKAKKDDVSIIRSPVGMPGRVLKNSFVQEINQGNTVPFVCKYHCLKSCDPKTAPYCIAKVLVNAADGVLEESFAFAGVNVYKCSEIISVKELIQKLKEEYTQVISS